jgi:hypothetical protein
MIPDFRPEIPDLSDSRFQILDGKFEFGIWNLEF